MRFQLPTIAFLGLLTCAYTGCNGTPAPVAIPEPVEKPKAMDIKELDGYWLLKTSAEASERGIYSRNTREDGELVLRIQNGLAEMRRGDNPWTKYATLTIGTEPQNLQCSKSDASGQQRIIQLRFKLEGNTLITVQDNLYPESLPESFEMEAGTNRQRQTNTYIKTDR
jgi:hypothetical protein